MATKRVIGIDPGLTGAVAVNGFRAAMVDDLPIVEKQINPSALAEFFEFQPEKSLIVIEQQQPMPRDGCKQSFRTGLNYGMLKAVAMLSGCRVEIIRANIWKKEFGLLKKDKDASRLKALELFPELADRLKLKKHHGRAEALLIAEYGRRKF